eukprot:scaffold24926_cov21-Prasinocladus_malaysianus.AAC.2
MQSSNDLLRCYLKCESSLQQSTASPSSEPSSCSYCVTDLAAICSKCVAPSYSIGYSKLCHREVCKRLECHVWKQMFDDAQMLH